MKPKKKRTGQKGYNIYVHSGRRSNARNWGRYWLNCRKKQLYTEVPSGKHCDHQVEVLSRLPQTVQKWTGKTREKLNKIQKLRTIQQKRHHLQTKTGRNVCKWNAGKNQSLNGLCRWLTGTGMCWSMPGTKRNHLLLKQSSPEEAINSFERVAVADIIEVLSPAPQMRPFASPQARSRSAAQKEMNLKMNNKTLAADSSN